MANQLPSDRILNTLRVNLPGATDEMLKLELFNTIDEFFSRSNAWRHEAVVNLSEGLAKYPLNAPSGTRLVRVIAASHNNIPVVGGAATGASIAQLQTAIIKSELGFPDGDAQFDPDVSHSTGAVVEYSIYYPEYLTLTVAPDAGSAEHPLMLWLALTVDSYSLTDDPEDWGLCDWMWDKFHDYWNDGMMHRMMRQKAKPYSDTQLAMYYGRRFRNAMAFARQEANRGMIFNAPHWRFPGFA